ncbi:NB-ARC domain-containing protein [Streptomyces sp. NPDC058122]|uniref:WD40 domain-containing protein n=1 Tax=Streptomyces sp. NPDC058122 TaxID=3346349 RepID=UPI0036E3D1C9
MRDGGRRLGQAVVASSAAAGVWLLVTALRGGWDAADPVASVLGGGAGIVALMVSLGFGPGAAGAVGDPPPPAAPAIPAWVVDRDELEDVVAAVCGRTGRRGAFGRRHRRRRHGAPVGITTGLQGAGGFGKTTLAHLVCAHPKVRRAFRGRIYVVTVGRDVRGRAAIAAKVVEATRFITGDTLESGEDPGRAGDHLGRLLAKRPRTLLVIDDVWEPEQLEPFLRGAQERCVRLVTTRRPAVLPPDAIRAVVDRMSAAQAKAVLTYELSPALPDPLATDLVKATGSWALLLRLVNQLIAVQAATGVQPAMAARAMLDRLRALGPTGADPEMPLDLDDPARRNTAVRASIQAATELLPGHGGRRFAELGIFAEDEAVPLPLVAMLWRATAGIGEPAVRRLCMQMADLSLLTIDRSVSGGAIALHDVVRDYLRAELGAAVSQVNSALLDAVAAELPPTNGSAPRPSWWRTTDGYLQDHLVEHLLDAGRTPEAESVAGDVRWIQTRLRRRGPTAPWRDLDRIASPTARALAGDLARAAHLLSPTDPPHALDSVLRSRLAALRLVNARPPAAAHPALTNRWLPPDLPDRSLLRSLTGSGGEVRAAAFSPDGTMLATVGDDHCVRLWNPATGVALRTLTGHEGRIRAVAFSPDGAHLATADDSRIRVWNSATGAALRTLRGHEGHPNAVTYSPDGRLLTAVAEDGRVQGWDPATGDAVRRLTDRVGGIRAVAFHPDGTLLATAGDDGWVRIWDAVTGTVVRSLSDQIGGRAVAFSPDGRILATAGEDRRVRLWNPVTGAGMRTLPAHEGYVNVVAFSPDGALLATAGYDRAVRMWNPMTGAVLRTLTGHEGGVNTLAFSPDGTLLAIAGHDRAVRLRDPATSIPSGSAVGIRELAVAAGPRLATADDDGCVRIWDPSTGRPLRVLTEYIRGVRTVAFNPEGTLLVTVGDDGQMWVWDPETGMTVPTLGNDGIQGVRAAAFSTDGGMLATADEYGKLQVWDVAEGRVRGTLTSAPQGARLLAFNADRNILAAVGDQGAVHLWEWGTSAVGHVLRHDGAQTVRAVAFSADGNLIATAGDDGTVRQWNPTSGAVQHTLTGHEGPVNSVAFSGPRLASVGEDGKIQIWDPVTGTAVTQMRTDSPLRCCAWSPDGRTLFAGGRGGLFGYDFDPGLRGS